MGLALEITGVSKSFGALKVIDDLSVTLGEGEALGIVGPNGAGKTTLFNLITGSIPPDGGTIRFDQSVIVAQAPHLRVRRGLGRTYQIPRPFGGMTVFENLELGAFLGGARQAKETTMSWVYEVFPVLKNRRKQKAGTLSGGEQQMLLIGRALMSQPKLLMIDELSFGLAPLLVQNLFKTLKQVHESTRISILLVDQNVRMALEFSDRAYIIGDGSIVIEGKAQDFLSSQQVKDAYFGIGSED